MVTIDGSEYINTVLMHESGESIESHTKIICKSQNDPQAYGSGVTYARRYGLQSFMSIGADDDDGQKATILPKKVELTLEQKQNEKDLLNSKDLESLGKTWKSLSQSEQKRNYLLKDQRKDYLTLKSE
jgi:hypothetical protein